MTLEDKFAGMAMDEPIKIEIEGEELELDVRVEDIVPLMSMGGQGEDAGQARLVSEANILPGTLFQITEQTQFQDTATGVGGGGGNTSDRVAVNYRDLLGAGPVLDAEDRIVCNTRVIKNRTAYDADMSVRGSIIYDIATVDDAASKFGIPR